MNVWLDRTLMAAGLPGYLMPSDGGSGGGTDRGDTSENEGDFGEGASRGGGSGSETSNRQSPQDFGATGDNEAQEAADQAANNAAEASDEQADENEAVNQFGAFADEVNGSYLVAIMYALGFSKPNPDAIRGALMSNPDDFQVGVSTQQTQDAIGAIGKIANSVAPGAGVAATLGNVGLDVAQSVTNTPANQLGQISVNNTIGSTLSAGIGGLGGFAGMSPGAVDVAQGVAEAIGALGGFSGSGSGGGSGSSPSEQSGAEGRTAESAFAKTPGASTPESPGLSVTSGREALPEQHSASPRKRGTSRRSLNIQGL